MGVTLKKTRTRLPAEERKSGILTRAIDVFSANGYSSTDLQDIADDLGIAKGTIYLYFATKEALFLAAVDHAIQMLAENIDEEVKAVDSPVDKIKAIVAAHLRFFENHKAFAEMIGRERGEFRDRAESTYFRVLNENASHIEAILRYGVSDGTFRDIKIKKVTRILAHLLTGTIYTYFFTAKSSSIKSIINETSDLLLYGLMSNE